MGEGAAVDKDASDDTLGPLTRAVFDIVWSDVLFVAGSGIYVPDIILHGDPARGFVSYDPYVLDGEIAPQPVDVPQLTRDLACLRLEPGALPIGIAEPTLALSNLKISNLHAVEPSGGLTYPPGFQVKARTTLGALGDKPLPLTIQTNDAARSSFRFLQRCCVPDVADPTTCASTFDVNGHGTLLATISAATLDILLSVDPVDLTVRRIDQLTVSFDPKHVSFTFTIEEDGGDMGETSMLAMVNSAIQTGVSGGMVKDQINAMLMGEGLRENLRKLINQAIGDVIGSMAVDGRPGGPRD